MWSKIVRQARKAAKRIVFEFLGTLIIAIRVSLLVLLEWFLIRMLDPGSEIGDTIWFWTRVGALVIVSLHFLWNLLRIFFGKWGPGSVQKRRRQSVQKRRRQSVQKRPHQ